MYNEQQQYLIKAHCNKKLHFFCHHKIYVHFHQYYRFVFFNQNYFGQTGKIITNIWWSSLNKNQRNKYEE